MEDFLAAWPQTSAHDPLVTQGLCFPERNPNLHLRLPFVWPAFPCVELLLPRFRSSATLMWCQLHMSLRRDASSRVHSLNDDTSAAAASCSHLSSVFKPRPYSVLGSSSPRWGRYSSLGQWRVHASFPNCWTCGHILVAGWADRWVGPDPLLFCGISQGVARPGPMSPQDNRDAFLQDFVGSGSYIKFHLVHPGLPDRHFAWPPFQACPGVDLTLAPKEHDCPRRLDSRTT